MYFSSQCDILTSSSSFDGEGRVGKPRRVGRGLGDDEMIGGRTE